MRPVGFTTAAVLVHEMIEARESYRLAQSKRRSRRQPETQLQTTV